MRSNTKTIGMYDQTKVMTGNVCQFSSTNVNMRFDWEKNNNKKQKTTKNHTKVYKVQ